VNIRALGLGALSDLSRRAFGPIAAASRPGWKADAGAAIRDGRYLAAFDGQRLVAAARYHDMHQCWQGRWMPMAGVASVMVAPEDRGRGTGRALMTEVLGLIPGVVTRCRCSTRPVTRYWARCSRPAPSCSTTSEPGRAQSGQPGDTPGILGASGGPGR
jgi:GNAT superfamily N-acetyltransferase